MSKSKNRDKKPYSKMSRRHFLKSGIVGVASARSLRIPLFESREQTQSQIKYTTLGRTGFKVSNFGFGGSRGNTDPSMIAYAIESNRIDVMLLA